ncbi:MAG: SDR family oxidoreductase [Gammaproteobacteria bacterium]
MSKIILITGATGSIGSELCKHLAQKGYELLITARNEEKLALLTMTLKKEFKTEVTYAASDFAEPKTFSKLIKKVEEGIDGLVIMPPQPLETTDCLPEDEVWSTMFKASFIGPVALIRDLIPALKIRAGGVVIISGISSKQPLSKYATSNVLRTAWVGQVKTLADVYGPEGLRFNTLSLGGIMTEKLMEKVRKEKGNDGLSVSHALKERFSNVPLRKYAEIKEVTDMIDILLNSVASKHITGQNMPFDGGFTRPY